MEGNPSPYGRSGNGSDFSGVSLGSGIPTPPGSGAAAHQAVGVGAWEGTMSEEDAERVGLLSGRGVQIKGTDVAAPTGKLHACNQ